MKVQKNVFFPTAAGGPAYAAQVAAAKAICAGCPVRAECLAEALTRIPEGIAGGLTAEERRGLTPTGRPTVAEEQVRTASGRGETAAAGLELLASGRPVRVVARLCGGIGADGDPLGRPGATRAGVTGTAAERFRPVAVPFADTAAQAWRAALLAQRAADPDHGDFYDLAAHVVDTLRALDGFVGVLAGQVAEYDAGRAVYDDEGSDPHCRLRSAVLALAEARQPLAEADQAMNRFWSAIGHIGTRYPGSPS